MSGTPRDASPADRFFPASLAAAADLKLAYAVERSLDAAVVGAPGTGKTTLLRRACGKAAAAGRVVVDVYFPQLSAEELLGFVEETLAAEFDGPATGDSPHRRIDAYARSLAAAGRGILIAVDDAHLCRDPATFETLQLLLNLRESTHVALGILLAGQPALLAEIGRHPSFAQRVAFVAKLGPMRAEETALYARRRLELSGSGVSVFDDAALERLHERTGGVPRSVDRLCDLAALIAEAEGRGAVGVADVSAAEAECAFLNRDAA